MAQWGDPDGTPVFALHGIPGSRLVRPRDEEAIQRAGLRLVTYDRPGYGVSHRQPGRRVVDCAQDVAAIADALGLDRFAVSGFRRGPHALAVAASLGDRVTAAECRSGSAPFGAEGLDWWAGMSPEGVAEFGWALDGERALHGNLMRWQRRSWRGWRWTGRPAAARDEQAGAELARPDAVREFVASMRDGFTAGIWGRVDDNWRSSPNGASPSTRSRYRSSSATAPGDKLGLGAVTARWLGRARARTRRWWCHAGGGHHIRPRQPDRGTAGAHRSWLNCWLAQARLGNMACEVLTPVNRPS